MGKQKHKRNILASIRLVLRASLRSFAVNRNMEIAATLAFYGFLSLMPLLLITFVILGIVLGSSETVSAALNNVLADLFPTTNIGVLDDLAAISFKGVIGLVSVIFLFWSMTPFAGALRSAIAKMFKMPIAMPFFKSKLIDLATIVSFLLLFALLTVMKVFLPDVNEGVDLRSRLLFFLIKIFLPFLLSVGFIGLFFMVFSPVRLDWHQWLGGAVAVVVMWSLMRNLFIMFVQFNPNYGYAFGSLKAIFLLIVWVYYSFAALLLGAEIMANAYRRDALLLHSLLEEGADSTSRSRLLKKFERKLAAGQVLFREGDAGHEMYVVLEGSIRLEHDGVLLAVMGSGDYFGEMSLLKDTPRSASAVAGDEAARLAVITKNNFDLLIRENPLLVRKLLEELAHRLDDTNKKLHKA